MKIKSIDMCLLFDFYGDILTDKQKELFDLYYNEDMSLAEISENIGITRQGVRDAVVRAEETLKNMEEKLGLVARYGKIQAQVEKVLDALIAVQSLNDSRLRDAEMTRLLSFAVEITKVLIEEAQSERGDGYGI